MAKAPVEPQERRHGRIKTELPHPDQKHHRHQFKL
jgi:hypothetical protein